MGKFSVKTMMNESASPSTSVVSHESSITTEYSPSSVRSIAQIAVEINFYKAQMADNIVEIGKRLIEAKSQLQHGQWDEWLQNGVEFSRQTANRFMQIAREFPNRSPVSDLPYTKLLALLQVPADERDEFVSQPHVVNGEEKLVQDMSKRELEQVIRERDSEKRKRKEAEDKAKKEYNNYMNALVKVEDAEKSNESLRFQLQAAQIKVKDLESRPVDIAVQELSEFDKDKLRQEGAREARSALLQELNQATRELRSAQEKASALETALRCSTVNQSGDVYLPDEATEDAQDAFAGTVEYAYYAFEAIVKLSNPQPAIEYIEASIDFLDDIIGKFKKLSATVQNRALIDQDSDLPEDVFGFEGVD